MILMCTVYITKGFYGTHIVFICLSSQGPLPLLLLQSFGCVLKQRSHLCMAYLLVAGTKLEGDEGEIVSLEDKLIPVLS